MITLPLSADALPLEFREDLFAPFMIHDETGALRYLSPALADWTNRFPALAAASNSSTETYKDEAGVPYTFRINRKPVTLENAPHLLSRVENLTDALHTQTELARVRSEYALLSEYASDILWTMDLQGNFTFVSPAGSRLRGYSVDELLDIPISETIVPEDHEKVMSVFRARLAVEAQGIREDFCERFEVRQYLREGGLLWTEVTVRPIRNDEGQLVAILGVTREIHRRKEAEERLARLLSEASQGTYDFSVLLKEGLTHKECEILSYLPLGYTNRQIGDAMSIKEVTVKKHLKRIGDQLGAQGKTEILFRAIWRTRELATRL